MQNFAIKEFFDPTTSTMTYVVYDLETKDAVVIDPVLDFTMGTNNSDGSVSEDTISQESFNLVSDFLHTHNLKLCFILETHAHADHLSASQLLKQEYPEAMLAVGERIKEVQAAFKKAWANEKSAKDDSLAEIIADGSQFDCLLQANQEIVVGGMKIRVIPTPGHTPACVSYLFTSTDARYSPLPGVLFTGDAIFMPDGGTGRCDFPGGSAEALYESIAHNIYSLPDETQIYVGHDYQPGGRPLRFHTTVAEQKSANIHLKASTTKAEFVEFRLARDKTLKPPRLLVPSLKVNLVAGHFRR